MGAVKNVAVIGAGMAGLACGQALQQAGFLVTVFEKSRGPSGRVSTRTGEGWQCDHGAQYFTVSQPAFATQVQRWLQAGVVAEWHGRLFETDGVQFSPKQSEKVRYVGVPKNTAPAREMAGLLEVAFEHTVTGLRMQAGKWHVRSQAHGEYPETFDQLVLAIPSPQAHALLAAEALPFTDLAGGVKMRGCWALMARYPQALDLPFDGVFVNSGPLSWVARDSSKPGRLPVEGATQEVWVLHASAEWSEANIAREAEAVAPELIAAFIKLGGTIPAEYSIHRWRYADCADYVDAGFMWDADAQLGLCGDWLNGGKVEGAWMSGYLLASRLAQNTGHSVTCA
ncbi:NAD(P)/FAD-dependent oxidoreductase [Methylophilus aquaticus]|uniref:FAD-dependent oxidoreductase n=1 Tax=Methylophilus aquaticus TaxID=1971610 RepID=A0ABT9JV91_9PROT|nr:FAD-dependent oxidoreductase [Methylophilus aquaticus]MDP8568374.1 FAD-dependent oxidoreductase [Methylophilus aquaticus]